MNATLEQPRPVVAETSPPRIGPSPVLVIAAFAAVYLIWGSTYLGIRLAIDTIPPLLMAGSRFLIAGLFLYGVMRLRGAPRPGGRQWGHAAVIGALLLLVGNGGVTWAQQMVPSSIAALMVAAVPLWMNGLEWLLPGGKLPPAAVFGGLALGFTGVALIVLGKDAHGHAAAPLAGTAMLVFTAMCWAAGSLYARRAPKTSSALLNVAMQMICGGTQMLAVGFALGEGPQFQWARVTATSAIAFLYLTVIGSLVAFSAYVWLLQVSTPARVSTYAYVNPFIAVLLGWAVLGETLPPSVLLAGALIIGAVVLIITAANPRTAHNV